MLTKICCLECRLKCGQAHFHLRYYSRYIFLLCEREVLRLRLGIRIVSMVWVSRYHNWILGFGCDEPSNEKGQAHPEEKP